MNELLLDRSILPWGGKNVGVQDAEKVFVFERLFMLWNGQPVELTEPMSVYALWTNMGDLMVEKRCIIKRRHTWIRRLSGIYKQYLF